MNDDFERELRNGFLEEATDWFADAERDFFELESRNVDEALIKRLFRFAHSLKGGSFAAQFAELGKFAHEFENLMGCVRDGKIGVNSHVVDVILECRDLCAQWIFTLKKDHSATVSCASTQERIEGLLNPIEGQSLGQELNEGDIIWADVEVTVPCAPLPAPVPSKPEPEPQTRGWVLVCDDENDIRQLLKESLEMMGYSVITAQNGQEAIGLMSTAEIDVIVSDVRMPRMNGIEFIKNVKENHGDVPVVFMSGHADKPEMMEMIRLGAFDFFEKPIDFKTLEATVHKGWRARQLKLASKALTQSAFRVYTSVLHLIEGVPHSAFQNLPPHELQKLLDELNHMAELTRKLRE